MQPELLVSEMPRCPLHDPMPNRVSHGWAELEPSPELPLVFSTLHQISLHTHCLLQSHGGTIPLARLELFFWLVLRAFWPVEPYLMSIFV